MIIGVPTEIKNNENRVALTPSATSELLSAGHQVFVQAGAGRKSGFNDDDFHSAGAIILPSIEDVYGVADLIVKVKEPISEEYRLLRRGQILFTFFHFASSLELTRAIVDSGAIAIAYETIELEDGSLPILTPMSEVAGRMSVQQGAKYLESTFEGAGILLGGIPGVLPANVVILGGGVVGYEAARMASGLGADVTVLDINVKRLKYINDTLPPNVKTMIANKHNIYSKVVAGDLVIGAVLVAGAKAPVLITEKMTCDMKPGAVLVDVAIDQGGCMETSRPTTHSSPTFTRNGVVHYCVTNMPGAVPRTSTLALTNATAPFLSTIADNGWRRASENYEQIRKGVNIAEGKIVHPMVANAFKMPCYDLMSEV